jgi:hypothetical protein
MIKMFTKSSKVQNPDGLKSVGRASTLTKGYSPRFGADEWIGTYTKPPA